MADSSIEWTDWTWNPVAGCTVITAGCTNCYAMRMAARLAAENAGTIELANLSAIVDEIKACGAANVKRLRALTGDFQLVVFRAARNDTIYRLLRHLQEQVRQFDGTTLTQPGRPKEAAAYCANLFAAIKRRDADAAEKLARENRRRTLELRIKMLRAQPGNTA